jgi:uncharacterized glyoxalase superfamily protein PhnB
MSETRAAVIPNIYVESVEPVRSFYLDKLGFDHLMGMVGKDGKLDFCIVTRAGAMVMLGRPPEPIEGTAPRHPTARPLELYIEVADVDGYHDQVRSGVDIEKPLTTQWWGDRNFSVRDPYGYRIWFYQTVKAWDQVMASGLPEGVKMV